MSHGITLLLLLPPLALAGAGAGVAVPAGALQVLSGQSRAAALDWNAIGRYPTAGNRPTYVYVGRSRDDREVGKCDPDRGRLRDGTTGPGHWVFSAWGNPYLDTLWDLGRNCRIEAIAILVRHPNSGSHPDQVQLTGLPNRKWQGFAPSATFDVPFQKGPTQLVRLTVNPPVVGRFLRVHLRSFRFQCAVDEIVLIGRETAEPSRPRKAKPPLEVLPASLPKVPALDFNGGIFGVCGHMIHCVPFMPHLGRTWQLDFTLPLAAQAGFSWYREPLYEGLFYRDGKPVARLWRELDRLMSMYERVHANVILSPMIHAGPMPRDTSIAFVTELARRYGGGACKAIELHNEPNLSHFWKDGDPDAYFRACKAIYPAVKAVRSNLPFIVGSYAHFGWDYRYGDSWKGRTAACPYKTRTEMAVGFHKRLLDLGVLPYCDGFSFHPYRNALPPEAGDFVGQGDAVAGFARDLTAFFDLTQKYNTSKKPLKFYITEIGYNTAPFGMNAVGSEQAQADYYARLMVLLFDQVTRGAPLEAVCWYDFKCDGTDPYEAESNYGIVSHSTLHRRKAWYYARVLTKLLRNPADYEPAPGLTFSPRNEPVKSLAWKCRDGSILCACWLVGKATSKSGIDVEATWPGPAQVRAVRMIDLDSPAEIEIGFRHEEGRLTIPLHLLHRPVFIQLVSGADN